MCAAFLLFTSDSGYRAFECKTNLSSTDVCLFDRAVILIKEFEGWHSKRHYPYVGYGHRILHGENFDYSISEACADSLLRGDLLAKCSFFSGYGRDSLLLGVLAYHVGENRVLKSKLIGLLDMGDRNIYREYVSFCRYKGVVIASLKRRREAEFKLLFQD